MLALKQEQLFDEIDILPIDLKTKIVDKILASITPLNSEIDKLWIKEANKRLSQIPLHWLMEMKFSKRYLKDSIHK